MISVRDTTYSLIFILLLILLLRLIRAVYGDLYVSRSCLDIGPTLSDVWSLSHASNV